MLRLGLVLRKKLLEPPSSTDWPSYGNLFITKDFIRYQEYKGHKYFADQPEYSVMNDLKSKVKKLAYDNPALTRALRGVQERFRAARLSSD